MPGPKEEIATGRNPRTRPVTPTQEQADGIATEAARLRALYDYEILESPPDPRFDRIVQLASRLIGMPIALISLLDASRQWIKARHGVDLHEMPRATAFCAVTVGRDELTIVEDAVADERFSANPLVTGVPQLRFYAGAPLPDEGGPSARHLCVMDTAPHVLSAAQGELLAEHCRRRDGRGRTAPCGKADEPARDGRFRDRCAEPPYILRLGAPRDLTQPAVTAARYRSWSSISTTCSG